MKACQAADCSKTFEPRGVGTSREKKYCSRKCLERTRAQTPQRRERQRARYQTPEYRAYNREYKRNNPRAQKLRKHAPFLAQRDGFQCMLCRRPLDYRVDEFHVDHIVPRSKDGSDDRANLQLACPACNQRKHNRMPDPTNAEQAQLDFPLQLELSL